MKRVIVLATLLATGALSLAVAASQQPAGGAAWKIPAKYPGYATPNPVRLLQNVQVVFDELK